MFARLHALSLDSVAVLLSAQWAVCAWGGVRCSAASYAFLAAGIWLGYTADRFADLRGDPDLAQRTLRHALHARHRGPLAALWGVVFVVSWVAGIRILPREALVVGAVLAGAAAFYALWPLVREADSGRPTRPAKSVVAAVLLTGAAAWGPFLVGPGEIRMGPALTILGVFWVVALGNLLLLRRVRSRDVPTPDLLSGPRPDALALRADLLMVVTFMVLALLAP